MQNANSCKNSCNAPAPLSKNSCDVLPYDGMTHNSNNYNIYTSMAPDKMSCGKHKYWNTCKVTDQKDVWGGCGKRGGVIHDPNDHPACKSRSNTDRVTNTSMMNATKGNYAHVNTGAYKSLLGTPISAQGNDVGSNVRDYYVYGAYTSSGGFVENSKMGNASCKQETNYGPRPKPSSTYVPRPGPAKTCGDKVGYQFANGARTPNVNRSGKKVSCEGLYRNYEEHNEQYLKDHYAQFSSSNSALPPQEVMDMYATDFTLLGNGQNGTTNYMSFGECVNPTMMDIRDRADNAHVPQSLRQTPSGVGNRCSK